MGLVGLLLKIVGVLILALIGIAAFLYFTDYAVEGTITEKGNDSNGAYVVIRPKIIPYDYKQTIDANSAQFVCKGYEVRYQVQSGRYVVSDGQGRTVYDSESGLSDAFAPVRCSLLGRG